MLVPGGLYGCVSDVMLGQVRSVSSIPNGQADSCRGSCFMRSMRGAVQGRYHRSGHIGQGHNIQGTLCSRGATSKNFRSGTHRSGTHQPCFIETTKHGVCVIQLVFAAQVLQIFKMCLPLSPGKPHINFQGVSVQCQGVLTKV